MAASLRVKHNVETKHKLSTTLRNWLPILHASLDELQQTLEPFVQENPLVEIETNFEKDFSSAFERKHFFKEHLSNASSEQIEALTIAQKSLYEVLEDQIDSSLFPTPISQKIARYIIENLDENGYYEGSSEAFCQEHSISLELFEKVRQRFVYIEPCGIGARNLEESFLFQLQNTTLTQEAYTLAKKMIMDLDKIHTYAKEEFFNEAMQTISSFSNPPNLAFQEESQPIVADLLIYLDDEKNIEVKLNDQYYPTIKIDHQYSVEHEYITKKIKEAKSLVDALEMRRATLYKVGLMIVEYQYDFFLGGAIKPLTLKTLADEFGHNPSTISRAIANKYIACDRGVFAMKEFFTTAIDEETSNAAIKEYIVKLIKEEPKEKPLSDMKLLELVQEQFGVKMVRRTIAKYRKQLNIAGSSERKKLYKLGT